MAGQSSHLSRSESIAMQRKLERNPQPGSGSNNPNAKTNAMGVKVQTNNK